jgi:hypothetical protein
MQQNLKKFIFSVENLSFLCYNIFIFYNYLPVAQLDSASDSDSEGSEQKTVVYCFCEAKPSKARS